MFTTEETQTLDEASKYGKEKAIIWISEKPSVTPCNDNVAAPRLQSA